VTGQYLTTKGIITSATSVTDIRCIVELQC